MLPGETLVTSDDEEHIRRSFYLGFLCLPFMWLLNIFRYQHIVEKSQKYHTLLYSISMQGDDHLLVRLRNVRRYLFLSKVCLFLFVLGWLVWLGVFQYKWYELTALFNTNPKAVLDSLWYKTSIQDLPLIDPYNNMVIPGT